MIPKEANILVTFRSIPENKKEKTSNNQLSDCYKKNKRTEFKEKSLNISINANLSNPNASALFHKAAEAKLPSIPDSLWSLPNTRFRTPDSFWSTPSTRYRTSRSHDMTSYFVSPIMLNLSDSYMFIWWDEFIHLDLQNISTIKLEIIWIVLKVIWINIDLYCWYWNYKLG